MNSEEEKPKSEFRQMHESLGLTIQDVIDITGTQRRAIEKWEKEGIVKNEAAFVLFKIAMVLQEEPHFCTKSDIVDLLFYAAGKDNPYKSDDDPEERKAQLENRLKSVIAQLVKM